MKTVLAEADTPPSTHCKRSRSHHATTILAVVSTLPSFSRPCRYRQDAHQHQQHSRHHHQDLQNLNHLLQFEPSPPSSSSSSAPRLPSSPRPHHCRHHQQHHHHPPLHMSLLLHTEPVSSSRGPSRQDVFKALTAEIRERALRFKVLGFRGLEFTTLNPKPPNPKPHGLRRDGHLGFGFRTSLTCLRSPVQGFGFRVQGLGLRV